MDFAAGAVNSHLMRYPLSARSRVPLGARLQRSLVGHPHVASLGRTISRNTYGNNKVNRNRNRNRNRNKERKGQKQDKSTESGDEAETSKQTEETEETANTELTKDEINAQDSENANGYV